MTLEEENKKLKKILSIARHNTLLYLNMHSCGNCTDKEFIANISSLYEQIKE